MGGCAAVDPTETGCETRFYESRKHTTYDSGFKIPGDLVLLYQDPCNLDKTIRSRARPGPSDSRRLDAPRDVRMRSFDFLRLSNMSSLAIASDLPPTGVFHAYLRQPPAAILWYNSCQRSLDPPHGGPHASLKVSFTKLSGSQYQDPYKQSCSICKDHGTISVTASNQTVRLSSATAASFRPKRRIG